MKSVSAKMQYLQMLERGGSYRKGQPDYGKGGIAGLDCTGDVRYFGFPHRVSEFIKEYDWATSMRQLGDFTYKDLKGEICKFWSGFAELKPGQIKIGHGSMQVLERINKVFIERGVKVLGYAPQFREYVTELIMSGADYEAVLLDPEENFRFHTERFLSGISSDYCLIYIDNPNNPTGQLIRLGDIEEIIKEAQKRDVIVVVDEAYADYADKENSAVNLIHKYQNFIVTRTFTKAYQLLGIRVGYGIFPPELSDYYDKVDIPFPIPAVGSYLAREALLDQEFIPSLRQRVKSVKEKLVRGLEERGYLVADTFEECPIFVLGDRDENRDLENYLLTREILTSSGLGYGNLGKNYVRVKLPAKAGDFLERLS